MLTDFDTIVIGAGPAGTAAAYGLKQYGYNVLLLDRHRFPRHKPCGGGITIKALNLIPWSIAPVLEQAIKKVRLGIRSSTSERFKVFEARDHVCTFARREKFDYFNFEKTIEAGVEFEHTGELSAIDEHTDFVDVVLGRRHVTARFVIGADGANSYVRRIINAEYDLYRGFAIEGEIDYADIEGERLAELLFGFVKNGYGWLFPKTDHFNVGIYTYDSRLRLSKKQLFAYAFERLGTHKLRNVVGFPIGFGGHSYVQNRERVILIGDAAGFAEPLLGEGIHNALKSGRAAAAAIIAFDNGSSPSLRVAYKKFFNPIKNDLICCERLAHRIYLNLDHIGFDASNFPIGEFALLRGTAAGMTMFEITNPFRLSLIRLLPPFYRPKDSVSLRDFVKHSEAES